MLESSKMAKFQCQRKRSCADRRNVDDELTYGAIDPFSMGHTFRSKCVKRKKYSAIAIRTMLLLRTEMSCAFF